MRAREPGLNDALDRSVAFAVFPDIGKAGAFIAGGAYGKGILYENGQPSGYIELKQGDVGLTLGGETFSELIILPSHYAVDQIKNGTFRVGADAAAVVLKSGYQAQAPLSANNTVFVMPRGGLMVGITVQGQKIDYLPGA